MYSPGFASEREVPLAPFFVGFPLPVYFLYIVGVMAISCACYFIYFVMLIYQKKKSLKNNSEHDMMCKTTCK